MESNRKKDPELADFLRSSIQKSGSTYEKVAEQLNISVRAVTIAAEKENPVKKHCSVLCGR